MVPDTIQGDSASLLLNEFVAKGSANANEFGTNEDWLEIFNPSVEPVYLRANTVFLSDNFVSDPELYPQPAMTIPGRGFEVIWADDMDTVANQIHANFKLSSTGDFLGISYGIPGSSLPLDTYQYGIQCQDAASNGRSPDGGGNWIVYPTPSPGSRNQ